MTGGIWSLSSSSIFCSLSPTASSIADVFTSLVIVAGALADLCSISILLLAMFLVLFEALLK